MPNMEEKAWAGFFKTAQGCSGVVKYLVGAARVSKG